jgi:hypothetical protein
MLVFIQGCAGAVTLIHNYAVTGSLTKMPRRVAQQVDGVPQSFAWEPPIPAPKFRFPEMRETYFWQLDRKQLSSARRALSIGRNVWEFFVTPWFLLPLFLALWEIRDRRVLAAWALLSCMVATSLLYLFFFPHYIAAYTCVFAFLIVRGLMVLDGWSIQGRMIGRWLALFIILGGVLQGPLKDLAFGHAPRVVNSREYVCNRLESMGGDHVVFVRYGANHHFDNEWVYNAANVDKAPIVWCRWMGFNKDLDVMRYYAGRQFWIVDVDGSRVATNVSRYEPQS